MNGPMLRDAAKRIEAFKEIRQKGQTSEKIQALYRVLFQRQPAEHETKLASDYLGNHPDPERLVDFIHGLMMTNEFAFVD